MARLDGKTAIVTGASSGNGRSMAVALAKEGASLVCADLQKSTKEGGFDAQPDVDTDDLIREYGGQALHVRADVSEAADAESIVAQAVEAFGRVDVLINNAGIMTANFGSIVDDTEENYERVMRVNTKGQWLCSKYAIAQMMRQPLEARIRGKIINLASISGTVMAFPGATQYAMSKGAVEGMTLALAAECAPARITVNAIAPGFFRTALLSRYQDEAVIAGIVEAVPLGEIGRPEDLGGLATFLASKDSDYLTGLLIPLDGGFTAIGKLPGLGGQH